MWLVGSTRRLPLRVYPLPGLGTNSKVRESRFGSPSRPDCRIHEADPAVKYDHSQCPSDGPQSILSILYRVRNLIVSFALEPVRSHP